MDRGERLDLPDLDREISSEFGGIDGGGEVP
jgi:hypothetical protein